MYKAIWSHKQIAVKKYHKNVEDFEWVRNRYARLLSADHENILKFYEVSESSNKELYLFMEYAKCQSLDTHIHGPESQKYSINVAIHWMTQCAEVCLIYIIIILEFIRNICCRAHSTTFIEKLFHYRPAGSFIFTWTGADAHIPWQRTTKEFVYNR